MINPKRTFRSMCEVATILLCAVTLAYPQEDQAIAAYNRGQAAFVINDFNRARVEFTQSYNLQADPLTAYFLCYAYYKLADNGNANYWANIALRPVPTYTLDRQYVDGAKAIADFTYQRLHPPPPPRSNQPGIGISASPITLPPPSPAIPGPRGVGGRGRGAIVARGIFVPSDLTGTWRANDGGTYNLRQIGGELWWYGRDANGGWTNVFHGQVQGDSISGKWADVPPGQARSAGIMVLQIQGSNHLVATERTGGFCGSDWTR